MNTSSDYYLNRVQDEEVYQNGNGFEPHQENRVYHRKKDPDNKEYSIRIK